MQDSFVYRHPNINANINGNRKNHGKVVVRWRKPILLSVGSVSYEFASIRVFFVCI